MPPVRFHPRAGTALALAVGPRLRIREVQSEFSFGARHDAQSRNLFEYRQVLAIDGEEQQSQDDALKNLTRDLQSSTDRVRKHMLEQFARTGLVDVATDYALLLLAFTSEGQKQMRITPLGRGYIGADAALSFSWQQTGSQTGILEFHGQESVRRPLEGTLWLRECDGLPLRISSWMEYTDASSHRIREEATVDYDLSPHGFLTPASVFHRYLVNGDAITENLYHYDPFKLFTATSSISFGDPQK